LAGIKSKNKKATIVPEIKTPVSNFFKSELFILNVSSIY